jgi:hypothetical protein
MRFVSLAAIIVLLTGCHAPVEVTEIPTPHHKNTSVLYPDSCGA